MVDSFLVLFFFSTFVFTHRKYYTEKLGSHHPHCGAAGNRDGFLLPLFMVCTLAEQNRWVQKKKRKQKETIQKMKIICDEILRDIFIF